MIKENKAYIVSLKNEPDEFDIIRAANANKAKSKFCSRYAGAWKSRRYVYTRANRVPFLDSVTDKKEMKELLDKNGYEWVVFNGGEFND